MNPTSEQETPKKKPVKKEQCECCGQPFASAKQLAFVRKKLPDHMPVEKVCHQCRRARTAQSLSKTGLTTRKTK